MTEFHLVKFLDITEDDIIPDETTICKFRNALIKANIFEAIFEEVKNKMIKKVLILNEIIIVDATLIHTSEPKRKRDDKGNIITNKSIDKGASCISKRRYKYYGYKIYITTDTKGIIKQIKNNKKFTKIRAIVELPFAFIKRQMNYIQTKFIGLHKNSQCIYLFAAAYNLKRKPV
ncbi:transposase [Nitrosophilus labii]|uniref:transposase n=1 Tax=Nitrosophilus labii TaxID=2706014 RepID=UPI0016575A81|nr:transposase [Nitrosophilus labii]